MVWGVIWGSVAWLFYLFFYFCVYFFSLHVEAPIKTEADVLAEDQVLHSNTPEKPSQDVKATVRNFSEAKYERQKKNFKKTDPKKKKNHHNYQTLFEPRTHHPYLLEMVSDFSYVLILWSSHVMKMEPLGSCVHLCVCFNVIRDIRSLESHLCVLFLKWHLEYS